MRLFTEFSRRFSQTPTHFFKVVFTEVALFAGASARPNFFSRVFSWLFPRSLPASRHHVVARGPGGPRASGPGPGPQAKVHFSCAGIVAKCVSCESSIAAHLVSAI